MNVGKTIFELYRPYIKSIAFLCMEIICTILLSLSIPLLSREIIDKGFIENDLNMIIRCALLILLIKIVDAVITIYIERKRLTLAANIKYNLEKKTFIHLERIKYSFFDNTNYGEVMSKVDADISNISSVADGKIFYTLAQCYTVIGGTIGLLVIDRKLTLLVLLYIPIKYLIVKIFASKISRKMKDVIKSGTAFAKWYSETYSGIKEIRLFGLQKEKEKEFDSKIGLRIKHKIDFELLSQYNHSSESILMSILTTIIYIIGGIMVSGSDLTIGSVFAFITYAVYVTTPIASIFNLRTLIATLKPSLARYNEFLNIDEENNESTSLPSRGDIVFRNVSLQYENISSYALKKVNMHFKFKNKVLLIGSNGSGKSSVIELILRLYKVSEGEILLSDRNINELDIQHYREMFTIVSQQIYLFNTSLRNNVTLFEDIPDEKVITVLNTCGLHEFVAKNTLDYIVGDNGALLSGGQKQKIALARAIIRECPYVIFDEATSSFDTYSEAQIDSLLEKELADRTVIIITHRPELIKNADYCIELCDGEIKCVC